MTEAERNKKIAKLLKFNPGMSDEDIKKSALGPTKARAAVTKALKAEEANKSPLQSFSEGTLLKDAGKSALNSVMGALNFFSSGGAGMAKAVEEPSKLKKPLAFAKGVGSNMVNSIVNPTEESPSVSKSLGMKNETWGDTFKGMGVDIVTDPATFMGAGLIRNAAQSGAGSMLKKGAKALATATAATSAVSQDPDKVGNVALPVGMVAGALSPNQWKGVPRGVYSALEREIEALGKKQMTALHAGKVLKARPTIKPDEWRDAGMDDILASRQEWNPQQLLEAVRAKRPQIGLDESRSKWKDYSTAKAHDSLEPEYRSFELRQQGVNSGNSHYGPDTVAHMRTDMATTPEHPNVQKIKDAYEYINSYEGRMPEQLLKQTEDWITKWQGELDKAPKPKRDSIINEIQSDLHQGATKKLNPEPQPMEMGLEFDNEDQYLKAHDAWEKLSPEEKAAKVGYRTPQEAEKMQRYDAILRRSVFDYGNQPKRMRPLDYSGILAKKKKTWASRASQGLHASPFKSPNVTRVPSQKAPHPDNMIGLNYQDAKEANVENLDDLFRYPDGHNPKQAIRNKISEWAEKPDPKAVMQKSWVDFMIKQALKDAVDRGANRIGVLTSDGVNKILGDPNPKPGRVKFYDKDIMDRMKAILRGNGIKHDIEFSEPEAFTHDPTAPLRDQYMGRFTEITPQIEALVKAGFPMYMILAMLKGKDEETR